MRVICVFTGDKYTEEDVYKLKYMVEQRIHTPFTFECISDRDYIRGIHVIPLPDDNTLDGWWNKLYMFNEAVISDDDILYFDLDVVIQKDLDDMISNIDFGKLTVINPSWKDFDDVYTPKKILEQESHINSSVIAFHGGTQHHIWEHFEKDINGHCIKYHGIDRFISNEGIDYTTFKDGLIYSRMYGKVPYEMRSNRYCHHPECTVCILNGMKEISFDVNYGALFKEYYPEY